jgi:hypothetical protein
MNASFSGVILNVRDVERLSATCTARLTHLIRPDPGAAGQKVDLAR